MSEARLWKGCCFDMKCPQCGGDNREDDLLCVGCGVSLYGMNKWLKRFIWVVMISGTVALFVPSCYGIF